mmetsp:Transcript_32228/g.76591  ORF Transcript_32228/g.76591 Transcript_32228/m.76591 type:complete len:232 (-) Transcript_32228:617-1312(-)
MDPSHALSQSSGTSPARRKRFCTVFCFGDSSWNMASTPWRNAAPCPLVTVKPVHPRNDVASSSVSLRGLKGVWGFTTLVAVERWRKRIRHSFCDLMLRCAHMSICALKASVCECAGIAPHSSRFCFTILAQCCCPSRACFCISGLFFTCAPLDECSSSCGGGAARLRSPRDEGCSTTTTGTVRLRFLPATLSSAGLVREGSCWRAGAEGWKGACGGVISWRVSAATWTSST